MSASHARAPRSAVVASAAIALLTAVASSIGLFVPGFYRDAPVLLPQVYGRDLLTLAVAVPAFALSAYLLWQRRPWGYAFTAVLLVKAATLGGAVLSMIWFLVAAGQSVVLPQVVIFSLLSVGLIAWLFLSIDGGPHRGRR